MDKDPGETPNPLTKDEQAPPTAEKPAEAKVEPAPAAKEAAEAPAAEKPAEASTEVASTTEAAAETSATAETKPTTESEPKSKKGLIAGLIIGALAIAGGGAAAAILLLGGNGGTIDGAMEKIASGKFAENINATGDVNIAILSEGTPIKSVNLSLNSTLAPKTLVNSSTVDVTLTNSLNNTASIKLEDIVTADHDIYVKMSGLVDLLENADFMTVFLPEYVVDCLNGEASALDSLRCKSQGIDDSMSVADYISDYVNDSEIMASAELIDNEWLMFSHNKIEQLLKSSMDDSKTECVNNLKDYFEGGEIVNYYKASPFVKANTEVKGITKKAFPVQKLSIDAENLTKFFNAVINSAEVQDSMKCFGLTTTTSSMSISENNVKELLNDVPGIYVEIDNNNNFTRLLTDTIEAPNYFTTDVDFTFNYPATFTVNAPSDYKDAFRILEGLMGGSTRTLVEDSYTVYEQE